MSSMKEGIEYELVSTEGVQGHMGNFVFSADLFSQNFILRILRDKKGWGGSKLSKVHVTLTKPKFSHVALILHCIFPGLMLKQNLRNDTWHLMRRGFIKIHPGSV